MLLLEKSLNMSVSMHLDKECSPHARFPALFVYRSFDSNSVGHPCPLLTTSSQKILKQLHILVPFQTQEQQWGSALKSADEFKGVHIHDQKV